MMFRLIATNGIRAPVEGGGGGQAGVPTNVRSSRTLIQRKPYERFAAFKSAFSARITPASSGKVHNLFRPVTVVTGRHSDGV